MEMQEGRALQRVVAEEEGNWGEQGPLQGWGRGLDSLQEERAGLCLGRVTDPPPHGLSPPPVQTTAGKLSIYYSVLL